MAELYTYKAFALQLGQELMTKYWGPMWHIVQANPDLIQVVPGFLIRPEKLVYYMGRTHIGIEYIGPERLDELGDGTGCLRRNVWTTL